MPLEISAHFDGRAIIPDVPLELPAGQRLRIRIETAKSEPYPLHQIADLATDMRVEDLAEGHQAYAHPRPRDVPNG